MGSTRRNVLNEKFGSRFVSIRAKGAMGFRNLHIFKIAMLGKLAWKLHTQPNSLMGHILNTRYFRILIILRLV